MEISKMSEHFDVVHRQAQKLDAEEWARGIKLIHVHSLTSCWYETPESIKEDFKGGLLTDVLYNDGRIERSRDGKVIRVFGEPLKGQELVYEYSRHASQGPASKQLAKNQF